jgi:hypothetical protein
MSPESKLTHYLNFPGLAPRRSVCHTDGMRFQTASIPKAKRTRKAKAATAAKPKLQPREDVNQAAFRVVQELTKGK